MTNKNLSSSSTGQGQETLGQQGTKDEGTDVTESRVISTAEKSTQTGLYSHDIHFWLGCGILFLLTLMVLTALTTSNPSPRVSSPDSEFSATTVQISQGEKILESSLPKKELDAGIRVYMTYHHELNHSDRNRPKPGSREIIREFKPLDLLVAKIKATADKIDAVQTVVVSRALGRMGQVAGKFEDDSNMKKAKERLLGKLKETALSFGTMLERAMDKFSFLEDWKAEEESLQRDFEGLEIFHKNRVEQAWKCFNEDVWDNGIDMVTAASKFDAEIQRARIQFDTLIKGKIEEFRNKAESVAEGFLTGEFDSALSEYDNALDQAVKKFVWVASSAIEVFYEEIAMRNEQEAKG